MNIFTAAVQCSSYVCSISSSPPTTGRAVQGTIVDEKKKHMIHIFKPILLHLICLFPRLTHIIFMASVNDVFSRAQWIVSHASLMASFAVFDNESKEIDCIVTR